MARRFSTPSLAESAFYSAFEHAVLDAMMGVWLNSRSVVCIHPGGPRLQGIEAVRASWERIFASGRKLEFSVEAVRVASSADLAIHFVQEGITMDGTFQGWVLATNIYQRDGGDWRMLAHHGSAAPKHSDLSPVNGILH